jgi:hypothetical protein
MSEEKAQIQLELEKSDIGMARLLEDLIEVLIMKNIINYTDLPSEAMQKIMQRQKLRNALRDISPFISQADKNT